MWRTINQIKYFKFKWPIQVKYVIRICASRIYIYIYRIHDSICITHKTFQLFKICDTCISLDLANLTEYIHTTYFKQLDESHTTIRGLGVKSQNELAYFSLPLICHVWCRSLKHHYLCAKIPQPSNDDHFLIPLIETLLLVM